MIIERNAPLFKDITKSHEIMLRFFVVFCSFISPAPVSTLAQPPPEVNSNLPISWIGAVVIAIKLMLLYNKASLQKPYRFIPEMSNNSL